MRDTRSPETGVGMAQEQSQKSGEPPIGECSVCSEPVTAADPGSLTFSATTGAMTHVHTRCKPGAGGHTA